MLICGVTLQMFNNIKYKILMYFEVKIRTNTTINRLFIALSESSLLEYTSHMKVRFKNLLK